MGLGSQEGGSELGVALTGTAGLQEIYAFPGKRSAQSPVLVAERAQSMHDHTRGEMLRMYYKDRNGVRAPYQERDMQYDITQGYLRKEGGGLVAQRGVLRRGPVGAGKRGRDGAGLG